MRPRSDASNPRREFNCPVERCGVLVRRAQLDPRTKDEMECDRDAAARKRVLAVFNAPASSFETARAHDDYLEQAGRRCGNMRSRHFSRDARRGS